MSQSPNQVSIFERVRNLERDNALRRRQVNNVLSVIQQLQSQCNQKPSDDPGRVLVESVLGAFKMAVGV